METSQWYTTAQKCRYGFSFPKQGRYAVKVKCAILLLGIGGVLISLSKAMSP